MTKREVGLYLGISSLGGVVVEKGRIVSLARSEVSTLQEETAAVSEGVRQGALINKVLREMGAEGKDIHISLADREFIIRLLAMPLMRKKEIASSLIYEIEKYIPFKAEELCWDYHYLRLFREKKINLSFLGMKESNFLKLEGTLSEAGVNSLSLEPSSLSLARVLKSLNRFSMIKNFALLDFTEAEAYITFFSNELLVFNRYLPLPRKDGGLDLEKFTDSLLLSFQYFNREFKEYKLDTFIIVGNSPDNNLKSSLKSELQLPTEMVTAQEVMENEQASVENLKALGAAGRNYYPCRFKPVLMNMEGHLRGRPPEKVPLNTTLFIFLIIAGIGISLIGYLYLGHKIKKIESKVEEQRRQLQFPSSFKGLPLKRIEEIITAKERKVNSFKEVKASIKGVSYFLEHLSYFLPQGMWLKSLQISFDRDRYKGTIAGYVLLADEYKEREGVDKLVSNLSDDKPLKEVFSGVKLLSSERTEKQGFTLTSFTVRLE